VERWRDVGLVGGRRHNTERITHKTARGLAFFFLEDEEEEEESHLFWQQVGYVTVINWKR
jgi:hypothetical protein